MQFNIRTVNQINLWGLGTHLQRIPPAKLGQLLDQPLRYPGTRLLLAAAIIF